MGDGSGKKWPANRIFNPQKLQPSLKPFSFPQLSYF